MDNNYGVHAAHCCKWHGCKYGDDDCPVVTGKVEQKYLCEYCYEDLDDEEYYRKALKNIREMKIFLRCHGCEWYKDGVMDCVPDECDREDK